MESIIKFLATGPKSTFDFRKEFGVYPRSKLKTLHDYGYINKNIVNRRTIWAIEEQKISEEVKNEMKRKFEEFVADMEANPIDDESKQTLEDIKGVLEEITDNPYHPFKGLKLVGSE
jgi:hypothetical protein